MPRKKFDTDTQALYVGGPLDGKAVEKGGARGPWKLVRDASGEPITTAQAVRALTEPEAGGIYVHNETWKGEERVTLHTYVHSSILHAWYIVTAAQAA